MFVVPDEVLETTLCDVCYKILSVGPVKIYPDGQTKCGRCSRQGDEGVISMYNSIARQAAFKCVNRFDGCRQLLTFADVADHESSCKSKKYVCPICPGTTDVPTFLMVKHFKEYHGVCYLKTPLVSLDLSHFNTKTCLYKEKDNLLFIRWTNTSLESIGFNTFHMGEQKRADKMTQKLTVHYRNDGPYNFETSIKEYNAFNYENSEGFSLAKPQTDTVHIVLELHSNELDILRCPTLNLNEQISSADYFLRSEKRICLPRIVSVSQRFENRISSDGTYFVFDDRSKLIPYCHNCSFPMERRYHFLKIAPTVYQEICEKCEKYYGRILLKLDFILLGQLEPQFFENPILYSCIWRYWGCPDKKGFKELAEHETFCPYQPPQACPVIGCTYKGKLLNLSKHFQLSHASVKIILSSENNIEELVEETRDIYVWVQHAFVALRIDKYSNNDYRVNILPCGTNNDTSKLDPKALIFSSSTYHSIVTTGKQSKITSTYNYYIKCYFEKKL
ncbi:hypothetical protein JTB14_003770 [Gonioctena quinquepunctata]|nr:hypothetical protein JTB14_003770 [Gonioctena quinquepunctata]